MCLFIQLTLYVSTSRDVQRHPRRRKVRHRNPWGQNKKLWDIVWILSVDFQENKIVAIRCHILRLKCTKFAFGWGSAPDPAGGGNSQRSPDYLQLDLKGSTSKGRGGRGRERERRGEGAERRERKEVRGGGEGSRNVPSWLWVGWTLLSTSHRVVVD